MAGTNTPKDAKMNAKFLPFKKRKTERPRAPH